MSSPIACGVTCLSHYSIKTIACRDVKFVTTNRFLPNNSIVRSWFLCATTDSFILFSLSRRVPSSLTSCLDEAECSWILDDLEVLGDIGGVVDTTFLFFASSTKGCTFDLFCLCWSSYGKTIGSLSGNTIITSRGPNCLSWKKNFVIRNPSQFFSVPNHFRSLSLHNNFFFVLLSHRNSILNSTSMHANCLHAWSLIILVPFSPNLDCLALKI